MKTIIINIDTNKFDIKEVNTFINELKKSGLSWVHRNMQQTDDIMEYHFRNKLLLINDNLHLIYANSLKYLSIEYDYFDSITEYQRIYKLNNLVK